MAKSTRFIEISILLLIALAPKVLGPQDTIAQTAHPDPQFVYRPSLGVFVPGLGFMDPGVYTITRLPMEPPVTGKPVSMTRQSRAVLRGFDGTDTTTVDVIKLQRDSQGRVRSEVDREETRGMRVVSVIISDPIKQEYIVLDSTRRLAQVVHPPTASPVTQSTDADAQRVQDRQTLPPKVILGIPADGIRTSRPTELPARDGKTIDVQLTVDSWRSRELGVELESEWTYADRMGEISSKTTKIDQSEPDASLFMVPGGYTVLRGNN
jgi:hypothetical protein